MKKSSTVIFKKDLMTEDFIFEGWRNARPCRFVCRLRFACRTASCFCVEEFAIEGGKNQKENGNLPLWTLRVLRENGSWWRTSEERPRRDVVQKLCRSWLSEFRTAAFLFLSGRFFVGVDQLLHAVPIDDIQYHWPTAAGDAKIGKVAKGCAEIKTKKNPANKRYRSDKHGGANQQHCQKEQHFPVKAEPLAKGESGMIEKEPGAQEFQLRLCEFHGKSALLISGADFSSMILWPRKLEPKR